ncbi:MAG: glycerophosphodiester phosphodiesterase [Ignavibacterium sp.]
MTEKNNMQTNTNKNITIVAHRGASYAAPENTIPSFELAFQEEADFIEGDFWLTKDNEIVCIHDSDTKRVSKEKIKLKVRSSTLSELKKLDVGSWKDDKFKGTTIPTLQEVLEIIPEGKGIYIEIKDDREIFVKKLAEVLKKFPISNDRLRIIAFNPNAVRLAKDILPEIKTYWLFGWYFSKKKCLKSLAQRRLMQTLKTLNCDGIDVNAAPYIDERLVNLLRENNLDFCAYDIDKVDDAVRLINLGVDSITTNFPLKMREEIKKLNLRNKE